MVTRMRPPRLLWDEEGWRGQQFLSRLVTKANWCMEERQCPNRTVHSSPLGPSAGHQRQTELWSVGSLKKRCSLSWHLSVGCYSRLWTTPKMGAQAHVKEGQWCLWKVWMPSDDMETEIWTLKQEGIQRKQLRNLWPKTQHPQERQSFFEQRKVLLVIRLATR